MFKKIFILLLVILVTIFLVEGVSALPAGANKTIIKTSNYSVDPPDHAEAIAGNVSEITITGYSATQAWHGYYGNVTGTIELTDSASNVMYNWSSVDPNGEVYASINNSVVWTNIKCFNFSDSGGSGSMNLSELESDYGVDTSDTDGVDETFHLNNHASFTTASTSFSSGVCNNTKVYNNAGVGTFDEVLLYDPDTNSPVFAALLQSDTTGFDANTHDFEMLVLDDGHSGDVASTTYYFYLEIT